MRRWDFPTKKKWLYSCIHRGMKQKVVQLRIRSVQFYSATSCDSYVKPVLSLNFLQRKYFTFVRINHRELNWVRAIYWSQTICWEVTQFSCILDFRILFAFKVLIDKLQKGPFWVKASIFSWNNNVEIFTTLN